MYCVIPLLEDSQIGKKNAQLSIETIKKSK
jgi:hypothetical protein